MTVWHASGYHCLDLLSVSCCGELGTSEEGGECSDSGSGERGIMPDMFPSEFMLVLLNGQRVCSSLCSKPGSMLGSV